MTPPDLVEVMSDGSLAIRKADGELPKIARCATCLAAGAKAYQNTKTTTIEELKEGELFIACDKVTKDTLSEKVVNIVATTTDKIKRIHTGTKYLIATGVHRIFMPKLNKYFPVDSLKTGMKVLPLSGALLTIDSITTVHATTLVYDISVTGTHNYFAVGATFLSKKVENLL